MQNGDSVVEFFYNLVPGAFFLFLLEYFRIIDLRRFAGNSDALLIFVYIVLGLFLGFAFQGVVVFFRRKMRWNHKILYNVIRSLPHKKDSEFSLIFELVYGDLKLERTGKEYTDLDEDELQETFYLMDSAIRKEVPSFLPSHFSSLFTFWANVMCGIYLFFFIFDIHQLSVLFQIHAFYFYFAFSSGLVVIFILSFILVISYHLSCTYLHAFYATMLNRYYMEKVKDKNYGEEEL